MSLTITIFLSGICSATFAASGVFFLKFWKAARDRFFLFFAIACWLIALERVSLIMNAENPYKTSATEGIGWVFLVRLLAYALILYAVIEKNRPGKGRQ